MRLWNNCGEDDGSVHCLGNGKMIAYSEGPNIFQIFGPPYSSPSSMRCFITTGNGEKLETRSSREKGTAIWEHKIYKEDRLIGSIVDFIHGEIPCLVRRINLQETIHCNLSTSIEAKVLVDEDRFQSQAVSNSLLILVESGAFIFNTYPTIQRQTFHVFSKGDIIFDKQTDDNSWSIKMNPGQSTLYFAGGPSFPEVIENTEHILQLDYSQLLSETREYWQHFTKRRDCIIDGRMKKNKKCVKLEEIIDNISVQIKVQQSTEGGVLAGYNYHLGYVRDQYGVFRCFLKLGYYDEAKKILEFYWSIWERYGKIHNAQGMGTDGIFHVHENDNVEITAYLLLNAFEYYALTNDDLLINKLFPMLEWAWYSQTKHLIKGMLPFNGDETYIAGGILPRSTLNDGSAESTLMFITSGEKLLQWVEQNNKWEKEKLEDNKKILDNTRENYYANFFKDGELITNNPDRKQGVSLPRFRHGVCEGACDFFGWTECNKQQKYMCPSCHKDNTDMAVPDEIYYLQSVSLMALYIGSSLIERNDIKTIVDTIMKHYKNTKQLPSNPNGNRAVGYDYGILLYNLVELKHPDAEIIYNHMLSILDSSGSWVEYYDSNIPYGTRCRPWESGINLEAAIHYVESVL